MKKSGKSGERSKKMIKTDKVVYRTRTQEEYDWLMDRLDEAGCKWLGGDSPISGKVLCDSIKSDSYILADKKTLSFVTEELLNYCFDDLNGDCFEVIEVSDLMETEKDPDAQDKTEEETGALEELEAIHKQLTNQIEDLRKQGKEPKAIEYTIKVCFE